MNIKQHGAVLGIVMAGALLLSACGSDNNGGSGSGSTAGAGGVKIDCGGKKTLKSDGSTAQAQAMAAFQQAYENDCSGYDINYSGGGSGQGVKDFIGKQTDFGGSDSPLDPTKGETGKAKQRCDGNDAWNLPLVFGPIAVTYNISGVNDLALDAPTLAKIFSGAITTWNDPAIAALNKGRQLPATKIAVIFRNDESGTTDNFQKYLTAAAQGAWTKGAGKTFNGGVGEGAKGNDGTSQALRNTDGGITYNEWSYAQQNHLNTARITNSGGGDPVALDAASAAQAVQAATVKGTGHDLVLDLNSIYGATARGAYPIILATYEIVCSKYTDADTGKAVKAFLTSAATNGQAKLAQLGYVPLPQQFKDKLLNSVQAIG